MLCSLGGLCHSDRQTAAASVLLCALCRCQDDIYQPWEDQLPYDEFSVRLPRSSIPDIVPLLSEITDAEYLALRAGLAKHWMAFVWDRAVGGTAVSATCSLAASKCSSACLSHRTHPKSFPKSDAVATWVCSQLQRLLVYWQPATATSSTAASAVCACTVCA